MEQITYDLPSFPGYLPPSFLVLRSSHQKIGGLGDRRFALLSIRLPVEELKEGMGGCSLGIHVLREWTDWKNTIVTV